MPPPAARLSCKVALITGAGRGFGQAIALAFAREGARVAANYLVSRAGAEDVVAQAGRLGGEAIALRGDVAREDDVKAMIAVTLARFGRLDVLVNNAGVMVRGPLLQLPDDQCRRTGQILHPRGGWVSG
jgi:3-oxoacyl-[acyl-carrier protein] reductase